MMNHNTRMLSTRRCRPAGQNHCRRRACVIVCHAMPRRQALALLGSTLLTTQQMQSPGAVLPNPAIEMAALAPNFNISRVVKGCWQLSGAHQGDSASDRTGGRAAIEDFTRFFRSGITTFDTADHYGPSELLIGKWLHEYSEAIGADVRNQVQVMTKVCVFDGMSMAGVNQGSITKAVEARVRRLGTKPDVVQFYWGAYDIPRYVDAAKYLAEDQARGRFLHLGVTNFDVERMQQITDGGVKLASNQLQYSLLDRRPENGMTAFCQSQGIQLLPYGVLAGGLLSERYLGAPASSVKLDTVSKRKYASVLEVSGGWDWFQRLLLVLKNVADKHQSTISNVAARWVLDKPGVAGVILGARNATHIPDYVALSSLRLDAADLGSIDEVLKEGRQPKGDCYQWERSIGPW